eukprot:Rmarinus@m.11725
MDNGDYTYTIEQAVEACGWGPFHNKLLFACGIAYMAEVSELVMVSFLIPIFTKDDFEWNVDLTLMASCSYVGMFLGAIVWGLVSDRYGRRTPFLVTVVFTALLGFASATANSFALFVVLRFFVGVMVGGQLPIDFSMYIEFLPTKGRGQRIIELGAFASLGLIVTTFTSYMVLEVLHANWRWVPAILAVPPLLSIGIRKSIPESPRFLLANGREDEAAAILRYVAETNGHNPLEGRLVPIADTEMTQEMILPETIESGSSVNTDCSADEGNVLLKGAVRSDDVDVSDDTLVRPAVEDSVHLPQQPQRWSQGWFRLTPARILVLALYSAWFLVQMGNVGVYVWVPKFFENKGISVEGHLYRDLMIMVSSQLPGMILAWWLVDHSNWGRKRTICFLLFCTTAATFFLAFSWTPVSAVVFSSCVQFFQQPSYAMMYVITLEAFPTEYRCGGLGGCHGAARVSGALSPILGAVLIELESSYAVMLPYAASFFLAAVSLLPVPDHFAKPLRDVKAR